MASQARHDCLAPQQTNAPRFVVPRGEGESSPVQFKGYHFVGSHFGQIESIANFGHDVKHLAGDFAAALVVGGGLGGRVVAEPRVNVVDGVTRNGALDNGTALVSDTT